MSRSTFIILLAALSLLVAACRGAGSSASPAAAARAAATPLPADSQPSVGSQPSKADSGAKGGDSNRFTDVKAWKGTFSATLDSDTEKTVPVGGNNQMETEKLHEKAEGSVVYDIPATDDPTLGLGWMGNNKVTVTIDDTSMTKVLEGPNAGLVETVTKNGTGEADMDEVDGGGIWIHPESGTYEIGFSANSIKVDATQHVENSGTVVRDVKDTADSDMTVGDAVTDVDLPANGFHLNGSQKTQNGYVITWDLQAVQ